MKTSIKITILSFTALFSLAMVVNSCSIEPRAWSPEENKDFEVPTALNEKLTSAQIISLGGWYGPEDIVFDEKGNLYCGVHSKKTDFSDGKILKIDSNQIKIK